VARAIARGKGWWREHDAMQRGIEVTEDAPEHRTDRPTPALLAALAATFDVPAPPEILPPLWHWALFQDWRPPRALGPDGHPRAATAPPGTRRMWAGGRLEFHAPLRIGETISRARRLASVTRKTGASGPLEFVTWHDELRGSDGALAVVEETDIVYRARGVAAVRDAAPASPPAEGAMRREILPDPVLLFRYSALTGNSHRIHYDQDYATREEGYPGLVVHGPMQATLLAALACECAGGAPLRRLTYRARHPAFAGRTLTLVAVKQGNVVQAETRNDIGAVCMTAEAVFG
jgi:3-methylfumaryl-CoA hydratase